MTLTAFVKMLTKGAERYIEVREALGAQVLRSTYKREGPRGKGWLLAKMVREIPLTPPISSRSVNGQVLGKNRIVDGKERRKFWNRLS